MYNLVCMMSLPTPFSLLLLYLLEKHFGFMTIGCADKVVAHPHVLTRGCENNVRG